jgi:hypothetical protein
MSGPTVQLDLRTVIPVAALAAIVLVIIFVELCGRDDAGEPPQVVTGPTATAAPTFTPGPSPTEGPSPTLSPADATATVLAVSGDEQRDARRLDDLAALQGALEAYRADNGGYPDTGGNIQTVCAFEEADAGCDLREFLDPLPIDPAGEGYWLRSSETAYTLFAQRESDAFEECGEHPAHLESFDSLLCVQGP